MGANKIKMQRKLLKLTIEATDPIDMLEWLVDFVLPTLENEESIRGERNGATYNLEYADSTEVVPVPK